MNVNIEDVKSYAPCTRHVCLLIHDTEENKLVFRSLSDRNLGEYKHWDSQPIVYYSIMSEFDPYFAFFSAKTKVKAAKMIRKLLEESARIALDQDHPQIKHVPVSLRKLFSRTLRLFRKIEQGCFLTNLFVSKLWQLPYRLWRYIQVYRKALAQEPELTILATQLAC